MFFAPRGPPRLPEGSLRAPLRAPSGLSLRAPSGLPQSSLRTPLGLPEGFVSAPSELPQGSPQSSAGAQSSP